MKAALIKIARSPNRTDAPEAVSGFIAPDTDDLFAIHDTRSMGTFDTEDEEDWSVTHLPTGLRVQKGIYTSAATREEAAAIAKQFHDEAKARGWPIASTDPNALADAHNAMSGDEKHAFWEADAGFTSQRATR